MSVCVAVSSHACYIWIVNDITDCSPCIFVLFYFGIVCVR